MSERRYSAYLVAMTTTITRIFRCLTAYVNHRLNKIKNCLWEHGGAMPEASQPFLSESEAKFVGDYANAIREYNASFPIDIDLFKDLEPPKDLFIQVYVLEDCGQIMTANGDVLNLARGATMSVRRVDVEDLIYKNKVVQTG